MADEIYDDDGDDDDDDDDYDDNEDDATVRGDDGMATDMTMMMVVMMSAAMCHPGQRSPLCGVQPDHTARAMSAAKRSNPDVAGG